MAAAAFKVPTFEILSTAQMQELLNGTDSASTKKSIKFGFAKFEAFLGLKQIELGEITTDRLRLDDVLCTFYSSLRREDGSWYSKKTMQVIRYGVQRHFLDLHNFDIRDKATFSQSVRMFKAVLVKLKKEGKGSTKHKPAISSSDMEIIQNSSVLDCDTPAGLQNKVFVDFMTYFCNRGRENLRELKPDDFRLETDEDGLRYITKRDQLTKNNREDDDEVSNNGVMYEIPGSSKCPVESFMQFVSKLNKDCPFLWQKPKAKKPEDGDNWYCNAPVGKNTMGNKMKQISQKAGCSKLYTNHCLRATCITTLDRAGFESRDIQSVSGHHSEQSLRNYCNTSHERKKQMSSHLGSHLYEKRNITLPSATQSVPDPGPGPGPSRPNRAYSMHTTRQPLEIVVPDRDSDNVDVHVNSHQQLSFSLSQEKVHQDLSTTSNTFQIHDCVVNIYNN
ncbi:uncharacterized protein LOC105440296 [Strongylocentrotus purpuratus]|uniref:Tyr recombinase domain-containing protein n=1 Tax=Strongylocentrotus purpuratus TaxID=7668 RepID=A0A7M7HEJ6_STRPU|nr:uncharacterized protein LOC105440296 [Strongylocentrotus purpuratus]|eukprot:XP_011668570.1 PREDICTED: uncharacterized protein LOC105440296 [Strongylocentrotus purpuratus]